MVSCRDELRRGGAGGSRKRRMMRRKLKGVRQRSSGKWVAEIRDTKFAPRLWLGTYPTFHDAVLAYDTAALEFLGPHAELNVPHKLLKDIYDSDDKVVGAPEVDTKVPTTTKDDAVARAEGDRQLQDTAPMVQTTLGDVVEDPEPYVVSAAEVAQFAAVDFDQLMETIDLEELELELDPAATSDPVYDESMWSEMDFVVEDNVAFTPDMPDGEKRDDLGSK